MVYYLLNTFRHNIIGIKTRQPLERHSAKNMGVPNFSGNTGLLAPCLECLIL